VPTKLVIEFEGGGGCWDEPTCSLAGPYKKDVSISATLAQLNSNIPYFYFIFIFLLILSNITRHKIMND